MKNLLLPFLMLFLLAACGDSGKNKTKPTPTKTAKKKSTTDMSKGVGEFTNVSLNSPLDQGMVEKGKAVYELKCAACHKVNDQRVVGPGFAGVTDRRKPEWIMNMVTNVEVMLDEDPVARELLKQCLVKMPNQNLSADDARNVLEWMYANDAK